MYTPSYVIYYSFYQSTQCKSMTSSSVVSQIPQKSLLKAGIIFAIFLSFCTEANLSDRLYTTAESITVLYLNYLRPVGQMLSALTMFYWFFFFFKLP